MATKNAYLRKQVLIDKDFQFQYLLTWIGMTMALLAGLVLASVSMVYLFKVREFNYLVIGNASCAVLITVLSMRYIVRFSHRIAGPAYRLERVIRQVADGNYEGYVSLRRKDYLKHVAESVNYMIDRAAGRANELKELHRLAVEFERALSNEPTTAPEVLKLARWQVEKLAQMSNADAIERVSPENKTAEPAKEIQPAEVGM